MKPDPDGAGSLIILMFSEFFYDALGLIRPPQTRQIK